MRYASHGTHVIGCVALGTTRSDRCTFEVQLYEVEGENPHFRLNKIVYNHLDGCPCTQASTNAAGPKTTESNKRALESDHHSAAPPPKRQRTASAVPSTRNSPLPSAASASNASPNLSHSAIAARAPSERLSLAPSDTAKGNTSHALALRPVAGRHHVYLPPPKMSDPWDVQLGVMLAALSPRTKLKEYAKQFVAAGVRSMNDFLLLAASGAFEAKEFVEDLKKANVPPMEILMFQSGIKAVPSKI